KTPATALVLMERITSRKNPNILHLRKLASDGDYRRECGEFVCDGEKLLREALSSGMHVTSVLSDREDTPTQVERFYLAPQALMEYASPLRNSPGPVFTVRLPEIPLPERPKNAVVLENVQDPGNVGTIIRAADALGIDAVVLVGECADLWSPRASRATMGAVFRQPVVETDLDGLSGLLSRFGLPLIGAALCEDALDIRDLQLGKAAVAIGNEGSGLSERLLSLCDKKLVIPMSLHSESLNAAMAATIVMWEMKRPK
ncbi:MAG: RNA methyltransferase, partial [Clostridia bacterium]|nr:RNA methyltransferase [Clostridia bacterium]